MSGIYYKDKLRANVTIPNPQDTATADLEKVKIDGTTYDVTDADAIHNADVGAAGGVAELDANGQVPSAQLPTPPTVNNNTITIQLNGTTVETFTLNQSSDETINIQVTKSDVGLGNVPNVTTDNQTPTVTEASTRANLASGDTLKTIIGKIKKYFSDLKDLAFIAKDGSSSTKYLRGDGTWQAFPSIPAAQVQSDWNQTDSAQVDFIKNKPTISDTKVTQNNTTTDSDRRVLLSASANDTNETNTARKSAKLTFNPSTGNLQATQLNGVTIGSSPQFTDNNTTYTLSADTTNNKIKLTPSSGSAQSITVPYATSAGSATDSTKIPLAGSDQIDGDLVPKTDSVRHLGSSSKSFYDGFFYSVRYKYANGYYTTMSADSLSGNKSIKIPDESGTLATREWAARYYKAGSSNGSSWRDTTASITVPAGTYFVVAYGRFDGTNKLEGVRIHDSNGGFHNQTIVNMTYGQQTVIPTVAVLTYTSQVTIAASVYTGTTSNVDAAAIVAFKL